MGTFLTVFLGVILGLIVLVAAIWFFLKHKFKKLVQELSTALGGMQAIPPFKITLVEEFDPKLNHLEKYQYCQRLLLAAGFNSAGTYSTDEIDELVIEGFTNDAGQLAALYDHPQAGVFVDLVCKTESDHWYVISSNSSQGMDSPKNCTKIHLQIPPDEEDIITRLQQALNSEISEEAIHKFQNYQFRSTFEQCYNDEMQWRIKRGGVTEQEILKVAEISGQDTPDSETIELVQDNWKMAIIGHIDDEVRDACLKTISMPIEEWEDKRERLFIIHTFSDPDNIACDVTYNLMDEEDERDDYEEVFESKVAELKEKLQKSEDLANAFNQVNQEFPEDKKYEKLCDLNQPYKATVFLSPKMQDCY